MQTNGLFSLHAPSARNTADNSFSEKPAQSSAMFGDIMHRALNNSGANSSSADDTGSESDSASQASKADKKRAAEKKSDQDASSQYLSINGGPVATPPPAANPNTGNSHDSKESKGTTTAAVSDDSAKPEATDTNLSVTADQETKSASSTTASTGTDAKELVENSQAPKSETQNPKLETGKQTLTGLPLEPNSDAAASADTAVTDKSDPQAGQIALVNAPDESVPVSALDLHGTSAAKQDVTMKKAEKAPKVAGQTEQDLPGIAVSSSEELPKGQKLSAKDALHGEKLDSGTPELPVRVLTPSNSPAPTETVAAAAPTPGIDSRVLERTHDIVALHAMRLNDTNSDSLHVVVKPGDGIQLSLELRQSARGIEVHASLHKGDFDQLNQHWPELQQRLEARGVRVGTLTTSENFTSSNQQQFQQSKQQSPNQDSLHAGAFAEFALAGSMTEAPAARAARATAYRGWETWA